ncbi:hypothetical protein [Mesoplasma melaleucae]|uniref:Uncharacterized protein n=1 Tax=Mesoplasma melaleucae TaxID=81459 RepID=A0A2K8NZI8_9MOLU|nr:hypothetical protein [Mesoplasma melaleucae]ATZ18151.1 hypothetical protein EMELA_v1c06440 [Mesoplasma melaleucae]
MSKSAAVIWTLAVAFTDASGSVWPSPAIALLMIALISSLVVSFVTVWLAANNFVKSNFGNVGIAKSAVPVTNFDSSATGSVVLLPQPVSPSNKLAAV